MREEGREVIWRRKGGGKNRQVRKGGEGRRRQSGGGVKVENPEQAGEEDEKVEAWVNNKKEGEEEGEAYQKE